MQPTGSGEIHPREGVWWVDGEPTNKAPGTLTHEGDTWWLKIHGYFKPQQNWGRGLSITPASTIHGRSGMTCYTLRPAYYRSGSSPPIEHPAGAGVTATTVWQNWFGWSLFEGGHVGTETLFNSAWFKLTGLNAWWPKSGLGDWNHDPQTDEEGLDHYQTPQPSIVEWDGAAISIGTRVETISGARIRTITESVVVSVKRERGFTFDWLRQGVISGLQGLLGVCLHRKIELFDCSLIPVVEEKNRFTLIVVDPGIADADEARDTYEFGEAICAENFDVVQFLPAWFDVAQANPVPLEICRRPEGEGALQTQVLTAVNAAETLHRTIHFDESDYSLAERVRAALSGVGGFDAKERRRVFSALKFSVEPSLERRLATLAEDLGDDFHLWFFNGRVKDWAFVSAAVRNALAHGFPTAHGVERDVGAMIGVQRITSALIRLRLLCAAGLESGSVLVRLLVMDERYLALINQDVADWAALAERIRGSNAVE